MNKVCAITGSSGYVGGCIKAYFAAHGWGVLEMVRRTEPDARAVQFQLEAGTSPAVFAGVDALVHCAYDFMPLRWDHIRAVNVAGTEKLIMAARRAGVRQIVCISSISAYDGCRSLYGKTKLEIEGLALDHRAHVIRPGLVYGRLPGGMFGKLWQQVAKSSVVPLIGGGEQTQYLVCQEDLCAFAERLAAGTAEMPPQVWTVANEQPWPLKSLLLEIARGQNKAVRFVPLPWRLVWLALRSAETCGLRLSFRSDSLLSLMYQNPRPDFSSNAGAGPTCRPFRVDTLGFGA